MIKILNWKLKESLAKKMTLLELHFAILDCQKCIYQGVDEGYYLDEASVYHKEMHRRLNTNERL
jgi:hypothetical protein